VKRNIIKWISGPAILSAFGIIVLCLIYGHLLREAGGLGHVLEELDPIMDALAGLGERLYWLGGAPIFTPMVLAVLVASISTVLFLIGRKTLTDAAPNRLLTAIGLSFFLLYVCGIIGGPGPYWLGILAVLALGFLGGGSSGDCARDSRGAANREKILVVAIVLMGLILRLYKLDVFPRLFSFDEQLFASNALELFGGDGGFFGETSWVKAHLIKLLYLRTVFAVFGAGMFQARTSSILEGVLCIVLIYFLCRRMWGNAAGVFAAFVLAVDPWHLGFSRWCNHFIESALFVLVVLVLLDEAVRVGGVRKFAYLGIAVGTTVYLYQSCYIMAPFAVAAAAIGSRLSRQARMKDLGKELMWLAGAAALIVLPMIAFGRDNLGELLSEQTMTKSFMLAAKDYGHNPVSMALISFQAAVRYLIQFTPGPEHPVNGFYLNFTILGLALVGLGMLLRSAKNSGNLILLFWIPVAFVPVALGYGFAGRRIFATFGPIPAMLAALPLAGLWNASFKSPPLQKGLTRAFVTLLCVVIALSSLFIFFKDSDPVRGGRPHPEKVPEFIGSIPPSHTIVISNGIQEFPFLIYIANYDRLRESGGKKPFSFVSFEELQPLAEKIAHTSQIAVITDPGPSELEFVQTIRRLNPKAEIVTSDSFIACIIDGD